ncbi:MAG: hypothetical protein KGZ81_13490 [Flavobacteriales bacterium]|nr:hypothetical protein [Flavobacteriales bacterium]
MNKQTLKAVLKRLQKSTFARLLFFILLVVVKILRVPVIFFYSKYIEYLLERKVRKAIRLSKLEDRRYIVTTFFGRPQYYTKQSLKNAIKRRKFKKGVTIQDIEKHAYFITK